MTGHTSHTSTNKLVIAGYVACGFVLLGSFGPWGTALGQAVGGTTGERAMTMVGALVGGGSIYVAAAGGASKPRLGAPLITVLVGALVALIAMVKIVDLTSRGMTSAGWGIWVVLISGLTIDAIGLQIIRRKPHE